MKNPEASEQGVKVVFHFVNKYNRDFFMGGLSDGWGENECMLEWEGKFDEAIDFNVTPLDPYDQRQYDEDDE